MKVILPAWRQKVVFIFIYLFFLTNRANFKNNFLFLNLLLFVPCMEAPTWTLPTWTLDQNLKRA